jgi:hypothetical protein
VAIPKMFLSESGVRLIDGVTAAAKLAVMLKAQT